MFTKADALQIPNTTSLPTYHIPQIENKGHYHIYDERRTNCEERSIDEKESDF